MPVRRHVIQTVPLSLLFDRPQGLLLALPLKIVVR
jgi:hypothetical protein